MSSAAALYCCLATFLPAHMLPDGFVERGIEVLVFPDSIEVHYRLGLSDGQMRMELADLLGGEQSEMPSKAAWELYRELIGPAIVENVAVIVGGESRPLQLRSVEPWVQHHVSLKVIASCDHQAGSTSTRLEVRDHLPMRAARGVTRMALRGRRDVEIVDSTAPANLPRAQRQPIVTDGPQGRPRSNRMAALFRLTAADESADANTAKTAQTVAAAAPDRVISPAASLPTPAGRSASVEGADEPFSTGLSPAVSFWLVALGLTMIVIGGVVTCALVLRRRPR